MPLRLCLFGAPAVTFGDHSIALPCERRTQLVVYLALKRTWVARSELAALLWPEQEAKLASTNLRKALHRLQSFPWADRIESRGNALRLDVATDVQDFEAALRDSRLTDALALYKGSLLAGFDAPANDAWTSWLVFERDRLLVAWRAAAQQLLTTDHELAAAVELASRLLDADPLDEDALRSYMSWLARAGQIARARQAYREYVARIDDELGLTPSAELRALHDTLVSGVPVAAAIPRPTAGDSFVGRAVEMRRAASLLADNDCRLLTITGPGGVGKTRMAQRVLAECSALFADGSTFVALDDLTMADDLGGRIASELGVVLKGNADPLDQAVEALRTRQALLVLDNFEQLTNASALVERLLVSCPRVKVVVTSRVRLGLGAEWLLPLAGLPAPEPEDVGEIETFDAVRLFIAAAQRVSPSFNAAAEAKAIVEICQSVEGLPLALELAAAWTRALSCREIAAELQRSAELLHSADASRPARHASIEAVFEQSWQLLGERERQALARLAVFRGGFSIAAARAVAAIALPVLAALVDKSLLRREGPRCYFHPLVHQFAQSKLDESHETSQAVAAHSRHFMRQLAAASDRAAHADPDALREFDAEFENIRIAWRSAVRNGSADELARAAYCLMSYCDHRGRRLEGLELLQEALNDDHVIVDVKAVPALAAPAAWLALRLDRYAEAEALGMKTLDARGPDGRPSGDSTLAYRAATILGATCMRLGRADEARDWLQRALDVAQQDGTPTNVASALDNLGLITRARGDLDGALQLYRQALLKHREVGDGGGAAVCLNNQAVVHILRNELDAAQQVLDEARQLCERHGLLSTRGMVEVNLANVALKLGNAEQAIAHARKALDASGQTGQRSNAVTARHVLVRAALVRGDLEAARGELSEAVAVSIAIGRQELIVHGVWLFAQLLAAQGAHEAAARALAYALEQPTLVAAERAEAEQQLRTWWSQAATAASVAWDGPPIDELAHRIVTEATMAYSPLIASLRSPSRPPTTASF